MIIRGGGGGATRTLTKLARRGTDSSALSYVDHCSSLLYIFRGQLHGTYYLSS